MASHARPRPPWGVLGVICPALFMMVLDTSIVHMAIPVMMKDLATGLDQVLWIVNAYVLSYAILMITAGRLGDRFGPKRVYLAGLLLFTLASALCGLSDGAVELIALRALQGVGAALLTPQTGALVTALFPPQRRGAAFGVLTSVIGVSIVAGPLLGGLLVSRAGWQWIFFVNVPVGIVALVSAAVFVPEPGPRGNRGWDPTGLALVTGGLTALTFGLLEGGRYGSGAIAGPVTVPWVLGTGIVLLVLFAVQQWRRGTATGRPAPGPHRQALLPRSLFAHRDFGLANAIGAGVHFAVIGSVLPITLFLQQVLGCSALRAGLVTAPTPLAAAAVAQVAGRLADRVGGKSLLLAGLLTYAVGLALIALSARPGMNPWHLLPAMLVADIGIGCVLASVTKIGMDAVDGALAGPASGVLNTTRQVGGVLGSAAGGALLQSRTAVAVHQQALDTAGLLPEAVRRPFVAGVDRGVTRGLTAGAGTDVPVPGSLDPHSAELFHSLAVAAYRHGFVAAMRDTALLPIGVLLFGAVCCLAVTGARGTRREPVRGGERRHTRARTP
ncbi:DHA2 family efflux MFS transporter permease subunit [Streptomyces sp. NPDC001250]|uniref:DHA2 family efflux MFS transporter permease subunit n=1 Tax=unclassified Streptomyces TaxID=2593676 RepID=UPI0033238E8D